MNQPPGLYTLCFTELVERLSYCGIQSLLVLYLLKALVISETQSYSVYGAFVGLTFITSIGAGIVADRVLGLRRAVYLGGLSILLGNILLALPLKQIICLAFRRTSHEILKSKENNYEYLPKIN